MLLPYTYPTPKLSPHRRRYISTSPPKNSLCMIYKRFKLWGHWKCPHKSPSPCNTYVIPLSLPTFVSSYIYIYRLILLSWLMFICIVVCVYVYRLVSQQLICWLLCVTRETAFSNSYSSWAGLYLSLCTYCGHVSSASSVARVYWLACLAAEKWSVGRETLSAPESSCSLMSQSHKTTWVRACSGRR